MNIKSFIKNSRYSPAPPLEYFEKIPLNGYSFIPELLELIGEAINNRDGDLLEDILIAASKDGLNNKYTQVLCNLLKDDWHHSYEDIIMMLEEIKDPQSTGCIYEASLHIPDHDDGRSLAKKCIWALGAINTIEAREKLALLAASDDPIISETATMQLNYKR